jgi:hypothetical protein
MVTRSTEQAGPGSVEEGFGGVTTNYFP